MKKDIYYYIFGASAILTVLFLVGIFVYLLVTAAGFFFEVSISSFLFNTNWNPTSFHEPSWGVLSLFAGTLYVSALALLIAVPFGLFIAIYLSEIASVRVREILKPAIEMIASIPSVTLGLLGLLFLAPALAGVFSLSNGLNALTASILVAIAALPAITSICEDSLSSVSMRHRLTSFALGANKWITIKRVVIPAAKSGLIASFMLGLGRVVGETMIVLMVAGNSRAFPTSLLDPVRPMTANIAIEIKEVVLGSLHWEGLFAVGALLFVMTFVINFVADFLIHRRT